VKVAILPSAKRDLDRGMIFYETQRQGLGGYFLESIGSDIDSIEMLGGIHPVRRDHHRFLASRFPYWIYYRIDGDTAYVAAILDARQNPAKILRRETNEQNKSG
jgi:hypothetical protein